MKKVIRLNENDINETERFEDSNVLIIIPTTFEEMINYGAHTKWPLSVTNSDMKKYFEARGGFEGNLRIYINKKTNEKILEDIKRGVFYNDSNNPLIFHGRTIKELPDWAKEATRLYATDNDQISNFFGQLGENKKIKKVVRLTENDVERLVKKIIKEEDQPPQKKEKEEKLPTVKQVGDGVLPGIDNIIRTIQDAKREYEDLCNAKLTGNDGYSKEIDGIVNDFSKLEDKVRKSKEIITNHLVKQRGLKRVDHMRHQQQDMNRKRIEAQKSNKPYFY